MEKIHDFESLAMSDGIGIFDEILSDFADRISNEQTEGVDDNIQKDVDDNDT